MTFLPFCFNSMSYLCFLDRQLHEVFFPRYSGFQGTKLSAPDPATKSKTAHVRYDTTDQATVALEALDKFQIKRGWNMRVSYAFL